ncbi:hypothetical protein DD509_06595 [Dehalogenimonas alkenigignens]|nr:hypothetical protein DD509_06595 [Dehalogenimonas alkenigignens]
MRLMTKISTKILRMVLLILVCVAYGSFIAYFFATQVKAPNLMFNPMSYHNFAIAAGAGIGLLGFILAYGFYRQAMNNGKADTYNFFYILNTFTGIAIGAGATATTHFFAEEFGLLASSTGAVVLDSGIAAFFGGGIGLLAAVVINENN